jgi:putative Mn2+ efflux pump MntP
MDCFAVAICAGTTGTGFKFKNLFIMALSFGGFQSFMAIFGWLAGTGFRAIINSFDHWIAFGLLMFVGSKMLKEGFEKGGEKQSDYTSLKAVILLSIATSIDAMAVGVSFSLLKQALLLPIILIGAASFIFTLAGGIIGRKAGQILGKRAEVLGGLILIGIGVKILIEHFK